MTASRLPGPPGILPGLPDALVDLNTDAGVELIQGQWRYHDAEVVDVEFRSVGRTLTPPARRIRPMTLSPMLRFWISMIPDGNA